MRKLFLLILAGIAISLTSCRNDFAFTPSTGGLEFSKDTVYLDTVFTNISSSTYRLKVYNRSDKDISIPKIQLGKGLSSKYRIMVDGMTGDAGAQGKIYSNVELLAKDSLFIFVEVTSDVASANPTDFLYTDQIQFSNITGAAQTVELVTLIQDAYFIFPNRTQNTDNTYTYEGINLGNDDENRPVTIVGSKLDHNDPINKDEYTWGNNKPYVIYGYALVPDNETLNITSGARVHFHANSGLIIAKNGTLKINGLPSPTNNPQDLSKEVIFEGDRLEPDFSEVPGQWTAIINFSNSPNNVIEHLTLKNATVGILSNNLALITDNSFTKLTINNSQIYNCSNFGILGRNAQINADNLVINNCGQANIAATYGGAYNFTNSTFNNNWNSSKQAAVVLNDYLETETAYLVKETTIAMTNCIVFGSNSTALSLEKKGTSFTTIFNNCLFKVNDLSSSLIANPLYDSIRLEQNGNKKNINPMFKNISKNQLWPTEDLFVKVAPGAASAFDLVNKPRNSANTNIGAYQFIAN
ncbi:hypothetical protein [Flavobacterium sp.]|uniref:hypothetical protein n=1 Tax=Flavobacterium sp. TaxID=239 RepID=UPI003BBFE7B5